jgi:hypothetical protein
LVPFFSSKSLITLLERMQVSSILSGVIVVVDLATSWLPPLEPLQDTPPITTADLLQPINFWHVNMTDLSQAVDYRHGKKIHSYFEPTWHSFVCFPYLLCVFLIKRYRNFLWI